MEFAPGPESSQIPGEKNATRFMREEKCTVQQLDKDFEMKIIFYAISRKATFTWPNIANVICANSGGFKIWAIYAPFERSLSRTFSEADSFQYNNKWWTDQHILLIIKYYQTGPMNLTWELKKPN